MITTEILHHYAPYELEILALNIEPSPLVSICSGMVGLIIDDTDNIEYFDLSDIKPILRPLSDLKKSITHDGETFIPINKLKGLFGWDYLWEDYHKGKQDFNINALKWASLKNLLQWHFNVFNLPENEYIKKV